nr:MAG TPA: hypothetical protein [Caudoviricetes sp.]
MTSAMLETSNRRQKRGVYENRQEVQSHAEATERIERLA